MARGDVKSQSVNIAYNTLTSIRPASGESWLVTGLGSSHSNTQVYGVSATLYVGNTTAGNGNTTQYYPAAYGGCKLFINNDFYLKFRNTSSAGTVTLFGIEI